MMQAGRAGLITTPRPIVLASAGQPRMPGVPLWFPRPSLCGEQECGPSLRVHSAGSIIDEAGY
jgi:hypothetical protein